MDIYFYNLESNKNALEGKSFKEGNVVVTKIGYNYDLYIQTKLILKRITSVISYSICPSTYGRNPILSFDPVTGRKGSAKFLLFLSTVFKDKKISDFFMNAAAIAAFKADNWRADVLSTFYGFNTDTKTKLEFVPVKKEDKPKKRTDIKPSDPELFILLDNWRAKEGAKAGVEKWDILRYRDLEMLSTAAPTSIDELQECGLKSSAIIKYGEAILELIRHHKLKKDEAPGKETGSSSILPTTDLQSFFTDKPKKNTPKQTKNKKDNDASKTESRSIELFLKGNTPYQIADIRNLTIGTVTTHLVEGVRIGKINVLSLIPAKTYDVVSKRALAMWPVTSLAKLFKSFNGVYTYDTLNYVLADLEFNNRKPLTTKLTAPVKTVESELPKDKSFEDHLKDLSILSVIRAHGKVAPHKAILLISILNLIDSHHIVTPKVHPDGALEQEFNKAWEQLVISDEHNCSMVYPFFQMKNEPFWKLVLNNGCDLKKEYSSIQALRDDIDYALLDSSFFECLKDRTNRVKIRHLLIKTYLEQVSES